MALTPIEGVCRSCGSRFSGIPRRSFYGFQELVCPECKKETTYPLTSGFRITYWIVLVYLVVVSIDDMNQGRHSFLVTTLAIVLVLAIARDWIVRRDIRSNRSKAKTDI